MIIKFLNKEIGNLNKEIGQLEKSQDVTYRVTKIRKIANFWSETMQYNRTISERKKTINIEIYNQRNKLFQLYKS